MAINVSIEGVSYTISAKDVSGPEIEKAIAGTKKLTSSVDDMESKMKSQFASIQKHWIAYSAVAVAAIAAISKAWDLAKIGADFAEQRGILDNLAAKYKTTADTIVSEMERASDYQIAKSELMKIALGGIAKGLNPKQLTDLADAALILGDAVGQDATTALKELTEALETGRTKGLKTYLGSSLDLKDAFGELEAKMTAAEKTQAMYSMTMMAAIDLQKQQTKAVDDSADKMAQVEKKFNDITLAISGGFKTAVVGLIDGFRNTFLAGNDAGETLTEFGNAAEKASGAVDKEAEATTKLLQPYQDQIASLKAQLSARKDNEQAMKDAEAAAKKEAETIKAALKSMEEDTRKAFVEIVGIGKDQHEKEIIRIEAEAEKHLAASKDTVAVNAWKNTQMELAGKKRADAELTNSITVAAAEHKAVMDMIAVIDEGVKTSLASIKKGEEEKKTLREKSLTDYTALMTDEADFAGTENERAINKIISNEGEKLNKLYQIYADGAISYEAMQKAEVQINKNAKAAILAKETETALKIADIEAGIYSKSKGYQDQTYEHTIRKLQATVAQYEKMGVSAEAVALLIQQTFEDAEDAKTLASNDFFGGYKLGLKEIEKAEKTFAQIGKELAADLNKAKTDLIQTGVTAFMQGENAKEAIQKAAGETISRLAGQYATMAFNAAIDKTIGMIGAYIGEGAAGSGAKASQGGAWAAVGEVALYLGTAVAAMLGGKALAQQFRAEGGWIGSHPGGGIINQGSGYRDDVYLGRTENTRHWGMGGEFVVNKEMTKKYADLLQAINGGYINKISDTGFAAGGYTGRRGQQLSGNPDDLALRMALGGELCFAKAFGEAMARGSDIYGAIGSGVGETIVYIVSAMGGALSGKLLGNSFKAGGGEIKDMGHFNWGSLFIPPGFGNPFGGGGISLGGGFFFNPTNVWNQTLTWFEEMYKEFLESQKAGWRNFAEVILTPGDMSIDPMEGLVHEFEHFHEHMVSVIGHLLKPPGITLPGENDKAMAKGGFMGGYHARDGLEYVPFDNFPILAHKGERVQTAGEASGLAGEVKALREDLNAIGIALLQRANKTGRAIESFTVDGAPAVRVSVQ